MKEKEGKAGAGRAVEQAAKDIARRHDRETVPGAVARDEPRPPARGEDRDDEDKDDAVEDKEDDEDIDEDEERGTTPV